MFDPTMPSPPPLVSGLPGTCVPVPHTGPYSREEVAQFMIRHGDLIRRRIRCRLTWSARRVTDTDDVFSVVIAKIDRLCARAMLRAGSDAELWFLVSMMTRQVVLERFRLSQRLRTFAAGRACSEVGAMAGADDTSRGVEESARLMRRIFRVIPDPADQEMLALKLRGVPNDVVARTLGLAEPAARQRWRRIRRKLRDCLVPDEPAGAARQARSLGRASG